MYIELELNEYFVFGYKMFCKGILCFVLSICIYIYEYGVSVYNVIYIYIFLYYFEF